MAQARSKKVLIQRFTANSAEPAAPVAPDSTAASPDTTAASPDSTAASLDPAATSLNSRKVDFVATEEPLEIRLNDITISTTMRTPGHDFELAAGFCHTEGLLADSAIASIRYCAEAPASETEFNVVSVETATAVPEPKPRLGTVTSACGVCGSQSIDTLCETLAPIPAAVANRFALDVLAAIPDKVRPHQSLFSKTGGVHAAAACDPQGEPLVIREDIGRHNAVDKVIGRLLLDGQLPANRPDHDPNAEPVADSDPQPLCLFVSGRASFEMLQKAWAGGFCAVVSVSSPSALAIELAQRANIQLAGFVRGASLNVYNP